MAMPPRSDRAGTLRPVRVAAVDIGATSGRVMAVEVGPAGVTLTQMHRFANTLLDDDGTLRWDLGALCAGVREGLRKAAATGPVDSVGVDTWAVDYGLLDDAGRPLDNPISYRDDRTIAAVDASGLDRGELYSITGIQHQRFNTVYQLVADRTQAGSDRLAAARRLLLMPDLLAYELTGVAITEVTNASTTGLLDAATRTWAPAILDAIDVGTDLLGDLVEPGTVIGPITAAIAAQTGLAPGTPVIAVASHDTASAVAAVPGLRRGAAFISSGTWSLVGIELTEPILTTASRKANFTNEFGIDGTVRYLRNVMGLWLLEECRRRWAAEGAEIDLVDLLVEALHEPTGVAIIQADDEAFLAPGNMPDRIAAAVAGAGGAVPRTPAQFARCITDSLALTYAETIRQAAGLSATAVESIHIVGGGSRNALLCRATADATGLPVYAGPCEATVIGNAVVQARTLNAAPERLPELRGLIAASFPTISYRSNPESLLARKASS